MKSIDNIITIEARKFHVTIEGAEIDGFTTVPLVLSKHQLQAAQLVGQSSKELIHRIYNRKGFSVLHISSAEKKTLRVDLAALWDCP